MPAEKIFVSPKIDFSFKEMMKRQRAIRSFLSAVLGIPQEAMKEVRTSDPHLGKRYEQDKLSILDVRLVLNNRSEIDIEMQVAPFPYWGNRSLYYNCRQFTDQAREGEGYKEFKQCIHISVLDFNLFSKGENPSFHTSYHLREDKTGLLYTDMLEFHVLELKKVPANAQESDDPIMWWGSFINARSEEEMEMLGKKDAGIADALEGLRVIQMDEEKRHAYLRRQMALMDYNTQIQTAREEGKAEGIQAGMEKGIEKGIEKGKDEGIKEGLEKVAQKALLMDMDIQDIIRLTGLSLEKIKALDKDGKKYKS